MSARSYWLEIEARDEREARLPKWAQRRIAALRRLAERMLAGTIESRERTEDERVTLNLGPNGHSETLMRVLPNSAEVIFHVTGGEMRVSLAKFGSRYRVRITGHGNYDRLRAERHEIAVLPAFGNVVEAAFVMPATDDYSEHLSLDSLRPQIEGSEPRDSST